MLFYGQKWNDSIWITDMMVESANSHFLRQDTTDNVRNSFSVALTGYQFWLLERALCFNEAYKKWGFSCWSSKLSWIVTSCRRNSTLARVDKHFHESMHILHMEEKSLFMLTYLGGYSLSSLMLLPCWWSVLQLPVSVLAYNLLDFFDELDDILFSFGPRKRKLLVRGFFLDWGYISF